MAVDQKELLRQTRHDTARLATEILKHPRAVKPRLEIARKWTDYYTTLSKIRPLKKSELRRLNDARQNVQVIKSRLEVYSASARYARKKSVTNMLSLRQAQRTYEEAKLGKMPPEQREKERKKTEPEKQKYDALNEIKQDIAEKCKSLKGARSPTRYRVNTMSRYLEIQTLSKELQSDFATAYEINHPEKFPNALSDYRSMNQ